jgi:hypothetical protein
MGHIFVVASPSEMTLDQQRAIERDYPGLQLPAGGRLASRLDIEAAFAAHPEWQIEFHQGTGWWSAFVRCSNRTASLRVDRYEGDPSRAQSFHFNTGDADLVVDIAAAIARRCGPFLIVDESECIVVLANPDGSRSDLGQELAGGSRPATGRSGSPG